MSFKVFAKFYDQLYSQPYHTLWFWLVSILIILIYGHSVYRIKSIQNKDKILEVKNANSTFKLEQTIKVLQKSQSEVNHQMHIQSRIIASISHDFRSPMNSIIYTSGEIERMIAAKQYDRASEVSFSIWHTSTEIKAQLDQLLEYIKLQTDQISIRRNHPVNIRNLVSLKLSLFTISDSNNHNTFINETPRDLIINTSYELLSIVVGNLIDNANKFTYRGLIKVHSRLSNNAIHLVFSNTESSIDPHLLNWLNSDVIEIPLDTDLKREKGLGLLIIKELIKLIDVQLWVVPTREGLEFHLIFPEDPAKGF